MVNTDNPTDTIITANTLPAILIGGPPNAGKSVLTHNLTLELRRREIPHYVFRASADIEGDWFLQGDLDTVREIVKKVEEYRQWTPPFRAFVCRDLAHRRHLPLLVDLGGRPRDDDKCIFQVCTHSILLLKDEEPEATQTWRHYTATNGLLPLAELRSQLGGNSLLTAKEPVITGTLANLQRGTRIHNTLFDALAERICQLFISYSLTELEKLHLDNAPLDSVVKLPERLYALASDADEWTADMLTSLLAEVSPQTAMAVYGRAPNWVYGALALHAGMQPFHQFDARLGWVESPTLHANKSAQLPQPLIYIKEDANNDAYVILIHPTHNYLDYTEVNQLVFPEPPSHSGVIVTGKLPLWLFTALARFYVQRGVPWIALNDAHDNRPVVIYSQVASHPIGKILPKL